jgi:hypothetical protein
LSGSDFGHRVYLAMATAASDSGVRSACAAIGAVTELIASPVSVSFDERPEPDDDLASNFTTDG